MIKVISTDGKIHIINCKYCKALLSYENKDIEKRILEDLLGRKEDIYSITCPLCNKETIIAVL